MVNRVLLGVVRTIFNARETQCYLNEVVVDLLKHGDGTLFSLRSMVDVLENKGCCVLLVVRRQVGVGKVADFETVI